MDAHSDVGSRLMLAAGQHGLKRRGAEPPTSGSTCSLRGQRSSTVMYYYGPGMGGWGMALMIVGNLVFWAC